MQVGYTKSGHFYDSYWSACYADISNNSKILLPFPHSRNLFYYFFPAAQEVRANRRQLKRNRHEVVKKVKILCFSRMRPGETYICLYSAQIFNSPWNPLSQACLYSHSMKYELIPHLSHLKLWFSLSRAPKSYWCLHILFSPFLFPTSIYPVLQKLSLHKPQISSSISYGAVRSNGSDCPLFLAKHLNQQLKNALKCIRKYCKYCKYYTAIKAVTTCICMTIKMSL